MPPGQFHGFDAEHAVVDHGGVHVIFIVIPVTRLLPKFLTEHHRGGDLKVVLSLVDLSPVFDESVLQYHSFRKEERKSRSFFHNGEDT